jgi:hypothetical protein
MNLPQMQRLSRKAVALWSFLTSSLVTGALITSAILALGYVHFGSLRVAFAYLRGERLISSSRLIECGALQPGAERDLEFSICNFTAASIKLLGATPTCGCIITDQVPASIAPGERKQMHLHLRAPVGATDREFWQEVVYYTDYADKQVVTLAIHGTVTDAL